jgi:hypothetical protein
VALRRRTGDEREQADRPVGGAAWADALERYAAMSVPERAAELLRAVAPAIAESWETATWKAGVGPRHTSQNPLVWLLIPEAGIRPDQASPEQHRTLHDLQVTLSEAFQALVLARLLVPYIYQGGAVGGTLYGLSRDGLVALERRDAAEVVASRLPA